MVATPLDDDAKLLFDCLWDFRLGMGIYFASCAVFMFDYVLTFGDEIRFIWGARRVSINSIFYVLSRYSGFMCMLLVLIWPTPTIASESLGAILRLIAIVMSEIVLALRTWAIWDKNKYIAIGLTTVAVSCVAPVAVIVSKDLSSSKYVHAVPELSHLANCFKVTGEVTQAYIIPYILTMVFEAAVIILCVFKILKLRQTIMRRVPLLERLWRDGMLYYVFMMLLSALNIALVFRSTSQGLRSGAANLQAVFHSMIATRILLHLAQMNDGNAMPTSNNETVTGRRTNQQFTTRFSIGDTFTTGTTHSESTSYSFNK